VVKLLKMLKQRGKKLFVLTNSPFPFVDGGMCYLFQDFKGENWKDLFDVVVALAAKPNFYTSQRPFRLDITHNSSFEEEFTLNATFGSVLIQYGCYQEGT